MDFSRALKLESDKSFGAEYKNALLKKSLLMHLAVNGEETIAELAKELNISVPTVTKLVAELKDDGLLEDYGKIETAGGRRPNVYGLCGSTFYFLGVDIRRRGIELVLLNFNGEIISKKDDIHFVLEDTMEAFNSVCQEILLFIEMCGISKDKIVGLGVSMTGRVNAHEGNSYTFFNFNEISLAKLLEQRIGISTYIENESRAMMYAEKSFGVIRDEKNVLFLNLGRGIGAGIMLNGKIYYGKTGFAGEFGHIPIFDNEIICHCGKKGCLETEASGIALEKMFIKHLKNGENSVLFNQWKAGQEILLYDIIEAANSDDMLAISLIEEMAAKLGRGVGILINLLNPDLVVFGGSLALTGDYLMLPMKAAVNKYSLSLVNRDTRFKLSTLGENASAIGVAILLRDKMLGII